MRWYVSENRKASGPFSEERIAILVQWGKISAKAHICDESYATWVPITRSQFAPLLPQSAAVESGAFRRWLSGAVREARTWLSGRPRPSFVALSVIAAALMAAIHVQQSEGAARTLSGAGLRERGPAAQLPVPPLE